MKIEIHHQSFELLPERAIYWPHEKSLILSDVHLGKAASLQTQGIPIPTDKSGDLLRISELIHRFAPEEVYVLGDWIHHHKGWTRELGIELADFFGAFKKVKFKLILGNHEKGSHQQLAGLPFEMIEGGQEKSGLWLTHGHKEARADIFSIQGHAHPVVLIKEGSMRLRLSCFVREKTALTLPSFGELTGGFEVTTHPSRQIFAIGGTEVFEVKSSKTRASL